MLTAAYVASEIVLPMIFAIMLNLLMQPALRALERLRTPRVLGALLLILVVIATIVGIGAAVSGPAEAWIAKLPEGIPRIEERLRFLDAPINTLRTFLAAANNFGAAGPQRSSPGPLDGGAILSSVFAGTRSFAGGLFTTVMFLYFLLVSGDSFLRRLVEVLPRFASKRQAVDISQQIGRDISAYLLTITLMNALVGAATAFVMWATGVGDPVLWGTLAFLLNYVPMLGPALIGDREPIVLRGRLPGMGAVSRTIIRIGDDSRAPLDALCNKLIAAGGACVVLRNQFGRAKINAGGPEPGGAPPSPGSRRTDNQTF